MNFGTILVTLLGIFESVVLILIKRYLDRKDKLDEVKEKQDEEMKEEIKTGLETIRLLAYHRMSEEIERLLNKGYATPAERKILDDMHTNYKAHGWNGDMDSRLKKVYKLPTKEL